MGERTTTNYQFRPTLANLRNSFELAFKGTIATVLPGNKSANVTYATFGRSEKPAFLEIGSGTTGLPGHILRGHNKACGRSGGGRRGLEKERGIPPGSGPEAQLSSVAARTILGRRGLSWPVRVVSVPRSVASFPVL